MRAHRRAPVPLAVAQRQRRRLARRPRHPARALDDRGRPGVGDDRGQLRGRARGAAAERPAGPRHAVRPALPARRRPLTPRASRQDGGVRIRPITPALLVEEVADELAALLPDRRLRVGVDGAPAAGGGTLAREVAGALRVRGRPAYPVDAGGFLRAASLRFEHGRTDPDTYYDGWRDDAAIRREVL